jgi:anti-anti-sigma factor
VIRLSGEHDLSTVGALKDAIATAVEHDGADLVFDLSEVAFMDSTTLHQIVSARSSLARSGRAASIRQPTEFASHLLRMTGLLDMVEAGSDADEGSSPARAELS